MPIIKSATKFLASFIFTTTLSLLIISVTLAEITSYESMNSIFVSVAGKKVMGENANNEETYSQLSKYCETNSAVELPAGEEKLEINCADIKSSTPDKLGDVIASAMFKKIYYKQYSCEFVECLLQGGENLMVAISSTGNAFFKNSIIYLVGITLLGAAGVLILAETFAGKLKKFGKDCMSVGVIAFLMLFSDIILPKFVPAESMEGMSGVLSMVTNTMAMRFLIVFAVGAAIFAIGFIAERKKILTRKKN